MVAFNEISGSPKITLTSVRSEAVRQGIIAWSDIDALIADVFPPTINAGIVVEQGAGVAFPGKDFLRADAIEFVAHFGDDDPIQGPDVTQDFDTLATYTSALATITYTTRRFAQEEDEDPVLFLRHRWSIGGEFLSIGGESAIWKLDSEVTADTEPAIFVPTIEHEITWPRVTSPPFTTIRDRFGKVNDAPFTFVTGTAATETLAFVGAEIQREVLSDGTRAWELTYRFSERRVVSLDEDPTLSGPTPGVGGWNHYWRSFDTTDSNVPGFYRVVLINASPVGEPFNSIYKQASFDELFQAG